MVHFSGVCVLFCPPITDGQASIIGKTLGEGKGKVLRSSSSSSAIKPPAIDFLALTHLVMADTDCRGVTLSALRRKLRCQILPATLPHLVSISWVNRSAAGKVKLDEGPFRVPILPEPEAEAVLEPVIARAGESDEVQKQEIKEDGGGGKRPRLSDSEQLPPSSSSSSATSASAPFPLYQPNYTKIAAEAPKDASGRPVSFKSVLSPYAARPRDFPASVLCFHRFGDSGEGGEAGSGAADLVVIYDRFPKACVHLLVLPAQHYLESQGIADLTAAHLPRLVAMHALARRLADCLQAQMQQHRQGRRRGAKVEVRLGYHAVPSIPHLHLHVISSDLDSPQLSKKAHWNSFTTDFLVPPERVEKVLLERGGCGEIVRQFRGGGAGGHGWTQQQEMRCPRCGLEGRSLPAMKGHYAECEEEG